MTMQNPRERHPDYIRAILQRAVGMIESGRLDSAEVLLATLSEEPSVKETTAFLRGVIAVRLGQNVVAQRFFKATLEINPQNARAHAQLGRLLLPEQPAQAAAAFAAALTLDAQDPDWHVGFAQALLRFGLRDFARDSLAEALARSSGHAEASRLLALVDAESAGAPDPEAISSHSSAADESVFCDALFADATRLQSKGELARAKAIFEHVLKRAPSHGFALCNLGALERALGNLELSARLLEQAVVLAPTLVPAHLALAETYLALDRLPAARAQFEIALRAGPENAAAHAAYAMALRTIGALEDAIPYFHRAVMLDQHQSADFYTALGATLAALGMHERAEVAFQHAAALAPDSVAAQRGLLQSTLAMGRHERARVQIEVMLARAQNEADAAELRTILHAIPA